MSLSNALCSQGVSGIPEDSEAEEGVLEVLRSAVNLARGEQIQRLPGLICRLKQVHPGRDREIKMAIKLWAQYEHSKPCN